VFVALAWRLTSTRPFPRRACDRGKGAYTSGRSTWVLHAVAATGRRGLVVVWPERNPFMTRARALKTIFVLALPTLVSATRPRAATC
jgi:hypothetical protein